LAPTGFHPGARAGQLPGFTGIDSEYEVPANPDLILGPEAGSLPERVSRVLELLEEFLR
jgi:bifunctional enzyme CysN/CysC